VLNGRVVGGLVQQSLELSDIRNLNLGNPAFALGAGVDRLSVVIQDGVAADDLAGNRG
jgi:hypothetical protein